MRITNINIPTTKHCPVLLKLTRLNFNGKTNENDIYSKTKNEHFEFLKKHLEKSHTAKAGLIFQSYKNQEISNEELLFLMEHFADKLPFVDFKLFAEAKIPLTKFDDEDILNSRQICVNKIFVTPKSAEFKENIDRILNRNFDTMEKIPSERKLLIVSGLPASGKNTLLNQYSNSYFLADPDEIKAMFPSNKTKGRIDNSLHKVAKVILEMHLIPKAIKNGKNIAIPTTGLQEDIISIAEQGKTHNYQVKLLHINIDKDEAIKRAITRYKKGGRFLDPVFILKRAPYINTQIEDLQKLPIFDEIIKIKY